MEELNRPLYEFCKNSENIDGDTFVGIESEYTEGSYNLNISFPLGYEISQDENQVRQEVMQLIAILKDYKDSQSQLISYDADYKVNKINSLPIQAYYTILYDFLDRGYYTTEEEEYKTSDSGRINWNRTIKSEKPILQNDDLVYLKFKVKKRMSSDRSLISEISQYCVYLSSLKFGWLFNMPMFPPPQRSLSNEGYQLFLRELIWKTFVDKDKILFHAMLDILLYEDTVDNPTKMYYGTNNFHYIWERMIDKVYGNVRKEDYFPRSEWHLKNERIKKNTALQPDTIMKNKENIFVLDAKYYKYGVTGTPNHLPESGSINKQISYGEYIDNFKVAEDATVYNAFLLPYNKQKIPDNFILTENYNDYYYFGEALPNWKHSTKTYENVKGILVDTKFLMSNSLMQHHSEILKLSNYIQQGFDN